MHSIPRNLALSLAWTSLLMIGGPLCAAWAEEPASADGAVLDEIIITAQRRSENLQDVPIAVSVVQGAELDKTNYRGVTDLQFVVPSLTFDPNNGGGFQVRGVGTQSYDFSNEQGVSVVLDDVVMDAQRQAGLYGLNDIDQIEVLRGPQGTLFGKNATAGVIAITTKQPVLNVLSGSGSVSYGERNDRNVYGSLNLPMGDLFALRISAFEQGQDGYGNYTLLDKKLGTYKEEGTRAKLLFKPSDDLTFLLIADYAHHWDDGHQQALLVSGSPPSIAAASAAYGAAIGPYNFNNADPVQGYTVVDDGGVSLQVNYKVAGVTLTSVSAFRYDGNHNNNALDFVPSPLFLPLNVQDLQTHKVSQEFRVASATGGFFEYVAGLYYNDLKLFSTQLQLGEVGSVLPPATYLALTGAPGGPAGNDTALFHNENRGDAVFGQVKFNFNEQFDVIAGGRVTHDNNSAQLGYGYSNLTPAGYTIIPVGALATPPDGSATATNFSYRVSPQYHINDSTMVYATYSTGYKGPGVAFVSGINDPYKSETVKSYEVGIKSELFNHHLRLNGDIFDEKYKDFQAQISETINGLPVFVIGNAGGLTSKGVEGDFTYRPIQSVTVIGAVTYNEAYFTNYVDGPNIYTGNTLSNAPRWASSLSTEYVHSVGGGLDLTANGNYSWRSQTYTTIGEETETHVGGYGLLGARIGIGPEEGHWHVGLYGRNLLDRYFPTGYYLIAALGTSQFYSPDAKRTVGLFVDGSF